MTPIPGVEAWYANLIYWARRWADGQSGALTCRKPGNAWIATWTADDGSHITVRAFDVTTALEALASRLESEAKLRMKAAS